MKEQVIKFGKGLTLLAELATLICMGLFYFNKAILGHNLPVYWSVLVLIILISIGASIFAQFGKNYKQKIVSFLGNVSIIFSLAFIALFVTVANVYGFPDIPRLSLFITFMVLGLCTACAILTTWTFHYFLFVFKWKIGNGNGLLTSATICSGIAYGLLVVFALIGENQRLVLLAKLCWFYSAFFLMIFLMMLCSLMEENDKKCKHSSHTKNKNFLKKIPGILFKTAGTAFFLMMSAGVIGMGYNSILLIIGHITCLPLDLHYKSYLEFIFLDVMGIVCGLGLFGVSCALGVLAYNSTLAEVYNLKWFKIPLFG